MVLTRFASFQKAAFAFSPLALCIAQAVGAQTLPSVTVTPEAETATGPVQGFAAKRAVGAKTDTPLIGPLRLALNVNNLADKVQITTCLARGDCFYGQRRTVVASARYLF